MMVEPGKLLLDALVLVASLTLTTVWHEFGHLLTARALRVPVKLIAVGLGPALWHRSLAGDLRLEVRAVPLGMAIGVVGRRTSDGHARRPATHDLLVAAAGPLASLLLGVLLFVAALFTVRTSGLGYWLFATGLLSALLALLNLLPVPGLDGGHILMLALALGGWQLTPQHEVLVHRMGMRVLLIASVLAGVFQILHTA